MRLISLFCTSTVLSIASVYGSPTSDPQVAAFLESGQTSGSSVRPLSLAERAAAGIKSRHLRPAPSNNLAKRDSITSPDVGQVATWDEGIQPQPQRGAAGSTFGSADTNPVIDAQNPDNVAAPTTDAGVVPNLKWSFSLSHTRLLKGGWVREQVIQDLPPCTGYSHFSVNFLLTDPFSCGSCCSGVAAGT